MKKQGFYWHCHHDLLIEYCYDYAERENYIRQCKSVDEHELRLRLFQPVQGKLPEDVVQARDVYNKA